jgi:hypothetical protein
MQVRQRFLLVKSWLVFRSASVIGALQRSHTWPPGGRGPFSSDFWVSGAMIGSFSGMGPPAPPWMAGTVTGEEAGPDERAGTPAMEGPFPGLPEILPEPGCGVPGSVPAPDGSGTARAFSRGSAGDFIGGAGYPCGGFPDAPPSGDNGETGVVAGTGVVLRGDNGTEGAGPTTSDRRSAGSGQTPS